MEYLIVILLVLLSALFSGLTLGLLGLNKYELERKMSLGDKQAKKVYEVRKRGNLLLCTLLLGNVAVNSTLSIFLGHISSGFIAGITATGLIVVFGEIIPQAACSRYALSVGAKTAWLVKIFIIIFYPICAPLAWALDKVLGEEMRTIWNRQELSKIIEEHEDDHNSDIDADEERIILGALSFSEKTAQQIMTPRIVIFMLELETMLVEKTLLEIKKSGFTRIPVYEKTIDNIVGILYVKDLIGTRIKAGISLKDIYRRNSLLKISPETKLDELLNKFISNKNHQAFVFNEFDELEGLVTLEDLTEEIFKMEIMDESDQVKDMRQEARLMYNRMFEKKNN